MGAAGTARPPESAVYIQIYGDDPVPPGDHQVRAEFTYDGDGLAIGGTSPATSTPPKSAKDASTIPCR